MVTFRGTLELGGKRATGVRVPDDVVAALGSRKRQAVLVTIGGHTYRSTVAPYDGAFMLPVSAENREAAGVAAGDEVAVMLEVDDAPRTLDVPADLLAALDRAGARSAFDALSFSNRQRHVLSVTGAKTDETRQRRIAKVVESLASG